MAAAFKTSRRPEKFNQRARSSLVLPGNLNSIPCEGNSFAGMNN